MTTSALALTVYRCPLWVPRQPLWRWPGCAGAKAWLHVQDFEVDAAFSLGLLRGAWMRRVVTGAEPGIAADAVVALYSGNMGGKQGLELLAEVTKLINEGQIPINSVAIVFVFCGNDAGRAHAGRRRGAAPAAGCSGLRLRTFHGGWRPVLL